MLYFQYKTFNNFKKMGRLIAQIACVPHKFDALVRLFINYADVYTGTLYPNFRVMDSHALLIP